MRQLEVRLEAALGTYDEDCRWDLINGMLEECPDDVLELAKGLLSRESAKERRLGADILGRLVGVAPNSRFAVATALSEALDRERETGPLASIIAALGHLGDDSILDRLCGYANSRDAAVRLAVAFSVATLADQPLALAPRATLIRLSRDSDSEVRDWATFGLGASLESDGPDVRAALLARADDHSRQARAEALFGLAVRRDPRAVPHLIRALQSPSVDGLEVDAAAAAADPRLLPALRQLVRDGLSDQPRVRRAIDRCSENERQALVS
jgi:HEAT repeat protein